MPTTARTFGLAALLGAIAAVLAGSAAAYRHFRTGDIAWPPIGAALLLAGLSLGSWHRSRGGTDAPE